MLVSELIGLLSLFPLDWEIDVDSGASAICLQLPGDKQHLTQVQIIPALGICHVQGDGLHRLAEAGEDRGH